jgi:hypothetical protein
MAAGAWLSTPKASPLRLRSLSVEAESLMHDAQSPDAEASSLSVEARSLARGAQSFIA